MGDLTYAYQMGVKDRKENKFVHYLRVLTLDEQLEYSRGWIDQWQSESKKVEEVQT